MTKTKKIAVCYVCDEEKPESTMTMIEGHMVCNDCADYVDPDAESLTDEILEPEVQEPKAPQTTTTKVPKVQEPKAPKVRKISCTSVSEDLIMAGKTNAEIWAVIQPQFNLDNGKKGYPAWYRMNLARKGLNPPTFAKVRMPKIAQIINAVQVHCD
jgi:hypothetical protein